MLKCILITFCFLFSGFCSLQGQITKAAHENLYAKVIADFIRAANKNGRIADTLFIAKPQTGEGDDITGLPGKIENTQVRLITAEAGKRSQKEHPSRIYVNLISWIRPKNAEFIFVVFTNGFSHQYDYHLHYTYDHPKKDFVLEKTEFKGPPFDK